MNILPVALQPGVVLGPTATVLYQVLPNGKVVVRRGVFNNFFTNPTLLTIFRVPINGVANQSNSLIYQYVLSGLESFIPPALGNLALDGGESVQALSSVPAVVNAVLSGYIIQ